MNDADKRRRIAEAAAAELQEAVDSIRRIGDEVERITGHTVVSPERKHSILDADRAALLDLHAQVKAADHALSLCLGWVANGTVGKAMKTMPPAAAAELHRALTVVGLLLPEGDG